ncbi:MAG: hypothetical protein M3Q58_03395 [Bacteroidota bacterium]|nr:hypothetical protein [Bacteroidota bacterium]
MTNIKKYNEKVCRFNKIVESLTQKISGYHPDFRNKLCLRLKNLSRNIDQNHHKITAYDGISNTNKNPEPSLKITMLAMVKKLCNLFLFKTPEVFFVK